MEHFTQENAQGYAQEDLDELNAQLDAAIRGRTIFTYQKIINGHKAQLICDDNGDCTATYVNHRDLLDQLTVVYEDNNGIPYEDIPFEAWHAFFSPLCKWVKECTGVPMETLLGAQADCPEPFLMFRWHHPKNMYYRAIT